MVEGTEIRFNDTVRRIVKEHGMTSRQVAEVMGITESAFNMMLKRNPTVNKLRRIAEIIGCDVMDFFKDEATHQQPTTLPSVLIYRDGVYVPQH